MKAATEEWTGDAVQEHREGNDVKERSATPSRPSPRLNNNRHLGRPISIVKRRKLQWYGHVSRSSGLAKNHLARHGERGKKTRQTEEEVGRQYQGMGRPGVRQVPEGRGEQGKRETTGCEIICGALVTLAVKGLMRMLMMMWEYTVLLWSHGQ